MYFSRGSLSFVKEIIFSGPLPRERVEHLSSGIEQMLGKPMLLRQNTNCRRDGAVGDVVLQN